MMSRSLSLFPGKLKKGYLVKSPPLDGTAFKKIFKAWKRRWCVLYLSDGKLYFQYYENEEKSHTGCPKNTLLLEDCKEITFDLEHPEYDNVFSIMLPERTYYFSAVSAFEMVDWVDKIREPLDLKRAGSLKVQKSVRRTTLDAPSSIASSITSSPLPIPPPSFPGGSHTLQTPRSPGAVTITPPLPPRNIPTSSYNGVAGFCTLPRQHVAKTTSSGSSEYPPLPSRNKSRDQHDELPPPPPPPHNPVRGRLSVDLSDRPMLRVPDMTSTNAVDGPSVPPLPPKSLPSNASPGIRRTSNTEINYQDVIPPLPPKPQHNVTPPKIVPRKNSSTTDYVNFEVLPESEKRPVPFPRTKKPILEN